MSDEKMHLLCIREITTQAGFCLDPGELAYIDEDELIMEGVPVVRKRGTNDFWIAEGHDLRIFFDFLPKDYTDKDLFKMALQHGITVKR